MVIEMHVDVIMGCLPSVCLPTLDMNDFQKVKPYDQCVCVCVGGGGRSVRDLQKAKNMLPIPIKSSKLPEVNIHFRKAVFSDVNPSNPSTPRKKKKKTC